MKAGSILMRAIPTGFTAWGDDALAKVQKFKPNVDVLVTAHSPRSIAQLRWWWALMGAVYPSSKFESADALHQALKMALGKFDIIRLPNGKSFTAVRSAGVESMPAAEFNEFVDQAINLICTLILPGIERRDVLDRVGGLLGDRRDAA